VNKAKILITDHHTQSRPALEKLLSQEHQVTIVSDLQSALEKIPNEDFDLIIGDRVVSEADQQKLMTAISRKAHAPVVVSADATGLRIHKIFGADAALRLLRAHDRIRLEKVIARTLAELTRQTSDSGADFCEVIEIELPSDMKFLEGVLSYLIERAASHQLVNPANSNTFVALDEALSNAIRHGNRNNPAKKVYIRVELTSDEARFTIRDEGSGFNPDAVPDPLDPANLYKNSGRGVLLIRRLMDEVSYNERGNEVTMIKRPERK
jgi:serine/threonine-protein kinase RsbW